MSDHILSLSTQVEPAKKFEIDDDEYDLLGVEHLSPEQEATVTARFVRFSQIARAMDRTTNERQQEKLAAQLRERRIDLITLLTTVPREVAEKLPPSAQMQLFRAVSSEHGQESEDGDEGVG